MKTIKITLITALIVLGVILYGQARQVQYINTDYTEKSSKFENLLDKFLHVTDRTARAGYEEPVVFKSYTVNLADLVYEENYNTETWMSSPFECSMAEADLELESWMTTPFESRYADADLELESWMTAPFQSKYADVDLDIEVWMTSPFKSSNADAELAIEYWMTIPFEAAEHIEIESWMTAAF